METKMEMGNYVVNHYSFHGSKYALLSYNVKIYYLINKKTNGVVCNLYILQNSFIFVKEKDIKSMNQ